MAWASSCMNLLTYQAVLRELDTLKIDDRIRREQKLSQVQGAIAMLRDHAPDPFFCMQTAADAREVLLNMGLLHLSGNRVLCDSFARLSADACW